MRLEFQADADTLDGARFPWVYSDRYELEQMMYIANTTNNFENLGHLREELERNKTASTMARGLD